MWENIAELFLLVRYKLGLFRQPLYRDPIDDDFDLPIFKDDEALQAFVKYASTTKDDLPLSNHNEQNSCFYELVRLYKKYTNTI